MEGFGKIELQGGTHNGLKWFWGEFMFRFYMYTKRVIFKSFSTSIKLYHEKKQLLLMLYLAATITAFVSLTRDSMIRPGLSKEDPRCEMLFILPGSLIQLVIRECFILFLCGGGAPFPCLRCSSHWGRKGGVRARLRKVKACLIDFQLFNCES